MAVEQTDDAVEGARSLRGADMSPHTKSVQDLARAVQALRPTEERGAPINDLIQRLESEPEHRAELRAILTSVVGESRSVHALTTLGILPEDGFIDGFLGIIGRRLLPEMPAPDDLHAILRELFPRGADASWFEAIPEDELVRALTLSGVLEHQCYSAGPQLAEAIQILAHLIGGLGLRPEISDRMPWLEGARSPFLVLSDDTLCYIRGIHNDIPGDERPLLAALLTTLEQCRASVVQLREEKHLYGTSLKLTALTHRLLQLIERLELLLHITEPASEDCARSVIRLCKALIRAESTRDSLLRFVQQSTDLLLFRVVERAAYKGAKYITSTRQEYTRFLLSSMGGGLIVGVFALFKVLIDQQKWSLGPEALLFSLNYALCFIAIHLTGSTLATKQPAVTAHALARCLDGAGDQRHIDRLVETITRIWRTQFISFVGNLICAFPMGLLVARLYGGAVGKMPVSGAKAESLLLDLHPLASGTLFYAAIAGVFLFTGGLVSGWVDNSSHHSRIPARVAQHPTLRALGGERMAIALSGFVDRHLGAIVGNLWLGLCLGTAGTLGVILGLPFDIRHIAFASAHLAMGLDGLGMSVPLTTIALTSMSVAAIGFLNFVFSFGMALFMAMESRRITFMETRLLGEQLVERLRTRPTDFFFPPAAAPGEP